MYLSTGSPPVEGGAPHLSVMALQVLLTSIIGVGAVVGALKRIRNIVSVTYVFTAEICGSRYDVLTNLYSSLENLYRILYVCIVQYKILHAIKSFH